MLAVDALEVGGVGDDHPHQIVELSCHQVALDDLRHLADRLLEGLEIGLILALQRDADEDVPGKPGLLLVDDGRVPLDDPRLLQGAHPPQARGLGEMDAVRQLNVGDASLALKHLEYGAIVAVHNTP